MDISERHLSFCGLIHSITFSQLSEGSDLQIDEEITKDFILGN